MQRRIRDTRQVSAARTLFLGSFSAFVILVFSYLIRLTVSPSFQIERWVGDVFIDRTDSFGWNFGFSALIFEGAVVALIYGSLFRSAHRSGPAVGLHLSAIHAVITGLCLSFTRFGIFGTKLGALNAGLLFLVHFIYGFCLGTLFDFAATKRDYPARIN